MAPPNIDRTLAEIVLDQPAAAGVLEAFGLDYCCNGEQPLGDACVATGVDTTTVVASLLLVDPSEPEEWMHMCPLALMAHLERTHHAYLQVELPRLVALARQVFAVHGGRHPELAEVVATIEVVQRQLEPHLLKEERVLFPLIRELVAAVDAPATALTSVTGPISVMLTYHDEVGGLLRELRALTSGFLPPGDGCASYRALMVGLAELEADVHLHVHKENNRLFPLVVALEHELLAGPAQP